MAATSITIRRMSPRPRKHLDQRSKRFETRFAIHLRDMLDKRGMTAAEFLARMQAAGVDVTIEAVKKWLRAERLPRPQDAETIGRILGIKDYRHVWPDPS